MILSEFAPAKINLFLSVIEKRPDNYHNIGTMFHTISIGDTLWGEADNSGEISLTYSNPQDYPVEKDLVVKVAHKLKEKYDLGNSNKSHLGVKFYLEKKLPLGAGLGGGSADAAAALRMLNKLWDLNLSFAELENIGAKLGADIPFLVRGGAAFAEGIGDILTPQKNIDSKHCIILVATPKCAVPTADAYRGIVPSGKESWENFKQNDCGGSNITTLLYNQFEESILPSYPLINSLKNKLNELGGHSLMSGSGASVFSIFDSMSRTVKARESLAADCRFIEIAKFM
ncbi:4-diphosphocytidyl-2-C-methyl-D-erythritol kinase [Fibrobacterales bacterium]|nr:4-diphosphocytidyl-2-C-methyl-D-erythritol kinase [Fibrobacterales bacterium]